MNEPKSIQEAQREAEVRQALTLSDAEKMQIKAHVDWHVEGIENVVQRALYEIPLPLFLKLFNYIDKLEAKVDRNCAETERLKRDVRRKQGGL